MAAFSTNTNILSSHSHQRRHLSLLSSSNLLKTHHNLHFPLINNHLNHSNTTATAAPPIFAAPPHASAAATTTAEQDSLHDFASTPTSTGGWAEFGDKVSGEWDGFGADFTAEGKPIELPERVVPEAYREWEVKVFDWQTQCPTLAQLQQNQSPSLVYKTIKLLPTVGCEADAATRYSIDERSVTHPHHDSAFVYQSTTGCYVALWPHIPNIKFNNKSIVEVEHCLIDPSDRESRVRIIQVLELLQEPDDGDEMINLKSISVFVEQWYGPFRNGDQLGGCAIRNSAFAASQPLAASLVSGVWQGLSAVATFHTSLNNDMMIQEVGDESACKSIRNEDDDRLILLPKQLWCSLKITEGKESCCEAGWLLDEGRAISSKCTFSSTGELKEIAIARETATGVL